MFLFLFTQHKVANRKIFKTAFQKDKLNPELPSFIFDMAYLIYIL